MIKTGFELGCTHHSTWVMKESPLALALRPKMARLVPITRHGSWCHKSDGVVVVMPVLVARRRADVPVYQKRDSYRLCVITGVPAIR